jgi:geranyl-CoA carboxylase beta subunit
LSSFVSGVDPASAEFGANRQQMQALIERLRELNGRAALASERRKPRFDERGQLTPRARLARLLDPGMPFLEIGNMAGYRTDSTESGESVPGGSVIAGIGFVGGARVMVLVDDSGINAGAMTAAGAKRTLRCQDIALAQKLPFIHLVESAGADLLKYTVEGFVHGGTLFFNLARLSAAGIPVITVLHGSATAGGAYMPGLSDYVIAVRGRARAFLAGPALLKAATGEEAGEEELGGADMHAQVSGLVEYLADDDEEAIRLARRVLETLPWVAATRQGVRAESRSPRFDPEEILGIVPCDYRKPLDVREVVARIVDDSSFLDFKPQYGATTVCLQAQVLGYACGIIGNNGPIDPEGAAKAAQFIQLCQQACVPLVFLQNTTGFMVGTRYERGGMIKHGSKLIQAVSNASVPRITFMIGASFGAGNYGMCGRGFDPDFLFSWPNARLGVMGGEQAARTMGIVLQEAARRKGVSVDPEELRAQGRRLIEHFDGQSDAFHASGQGLDDGLIDPRDTRRVLGFVLETCAEARNRSLAPSSFGVARF